MLTACDPIKEDGTFDVDNYTSSNLLDGAEFSQYADQACTTPQADGNYIKYNIPNASGIYIYYIKADGSEFKLTSGASGGVFNFVPARGSDPNQKVYIRFIGSDNKAVEIDKTFNVYVAQELDPEIRLLASDHDWELERANPVKESFSVPATTKCWGDWHLEIYQIRKHELGGYSAYVQAGNRSAGGSRTFFIPRSYLKLPWEEFLDKYLDLVSPGPFYVSRANLENAEGLKEFLGFKV